MMILDPQLLKELMTAEDVKLVLDVIGMEYKFDKTRLVGLCPNPNHIDKKASWDINVNKSSKKFCVHSCFSCGYSGDIIGLIKDKLNLSSRTQALKFLNQLLNKTISEDFLYERNLTHKRKFFEIRKIKKVKFSMPMEWELVQENDGYYNYLKSRRLSDDVIFRARIGMCETGYYRKRIVIPVFVNKKVAFFFARNNDDIRKVDKTQRGLYPKYSKSSHCIYPYDWLDFDLDYVILVEGMFDCLRLYSLGYKNVVCMFGNKISDVQAELLKPFKNIYMIPDADGELFLGEDKYSTKGMLMVQYAYEKLIYDHQVYWIHIPVDYDPNDVPEKILKEAFRRKTRIFEKEEPKLAVNYKIKKK